MIDLSGQCEDCPEGTFPGITRRTCIEPVAEPEVEIQEDSEGNPITCDDREIFSNDRTSCNRCFPFTRAQERNTICAADKCSGGIIKFSGKCEVCPLG